MAELTKTAVVWKSMVSKIRFVLCMCRVAVLKREWVGSGKDFSPLLPCVLSFSMSWCFSCFSGLEYFLWSCYLKDSLTLSGCIAVPFLISFLKTFRKFDGIFIL